MIAATIGNEKPYLKPVWIETSILTQRSDNGIM